MPGRHPVDPPSTTTGDRTRSLRSRSVSVLRGRTRALRVVAVLFGILVLSYTFVSTATGAAQPGGGASAGPNDVAPGVAAPVDQVAPPAGQPVTRKGPKPRPTVTANEGRFTVDAPAKFPDGVSLRVDKIARGVEQGEGPGVFKGRPNTALTLSLTNQSAQPIDLTQVVVTTTYGSPPRVASPVYEDPTAADFTGTVAPGATATATYIFAIPPGQARSAVTTVDFDDVHVAAKFTGLSE